MSSLPLQTSMYKIIRNGRRFNTKTYNSYEEARKAVRRLVTRLTGGYRDSFGFAGFAIKRG